MQMENADLILHNGLLWTGDALRPHAEALAVVDGRIIFAGSSSEVLSKYKSPDSVDLHGRRLLPGLHDSHMHLINTGKALQTVDLTGCSSISEMIDRYRGFLHKKGGAGSEDDLLTGRGFLHKKGGAGNEDDFLMGRGFLQDGFIEKRMPTRDDLDLISTQHPIVALRACGHILVCNSRVLELAKIGKGFGQVEGGEIGYDSEGRPNGVFSENAINLINAIIPPPTVETLQETISIAASQLLRCGITTAHTDDLDNKDWELKHRAYAAAAKAGRLKVRLNHQLRFDKQEDVSAFVSWRDEHAGEYGFDPEFFCYGPVKLMCDGSLGGRTAALREPYADDPGTSGIAVLDKEKMVAILSEANRFGFKLCGHAIGDRAISDLVEAMGEVVPPQSRKAARSRVIHAQITTPDILERMRELHIHCDVQPPFVATDHGIVADRVGRAKAQTSYAWRTMRRMGITTSGGSDSPVESCNPFYGIYCAVTRQTAAGEPPGGWHPEQCLSVEEALRLYTCDAAYAAGTENVTGCLKPGYYADFILLDRDILSIPHQDIKDVNVLSTWVAGGQVYDK